MKKPSYSELEIELGKLKEEIEIANTILDTIPDPVFVKDANFRYTNCNAAFVNLLGIPKEKIINSTVYDIAPAELAENYNEADCKLRNQTDNQIYESKVRFADGTLHDIVFHKAAIISNSKFCGITGIMFDVTERKKTEKIIQDYIKSLKESNLEKDKFLSIIAHELKSPFTSILGFTDVILRNNEKYDIPKILKYVTLINTSAAQTFALLENLLMWANVNRDKMMFKPQKILLSKIVESSWDILSNMAARKNIKLENNISKDYEISVDTKMIDCVIRNLITNAIKYTQSNGTVGLYAVKKNRHIEIKIKDNGIGISDKYKRDLFKVDLSPSTLGTAGERGTGLGLLICKEFIEKHGGKIRVRSEEGHGSEFIFILPIVQ